MAKPKVYEVQRCIRLTGDQAARLRSLRRLIPREPGEPATDAMVIRWLLDDPDALKRAREARAAKNGA